MTITAGSTLHTDYEAATWTAAASTGAMLKPTGLADKDMLWGFLYDQVAASLWNTRPSGFTEAYHTTATSTRGLAADWKPIPTATSEPANYTFGNTATGRGCALLMRFAGEDQTTAVDALPATDVANTTSGNSIVIPSVTVVNADSYRVVPVYANGTGGVTYTFSAPGCTLLASTNVNNAGSTSSLGVLVQQLSASGATGTLTVTCIPSDSVTAAASSGGFQMSLRGAPVAVTPNATITLSGTGTATAQNGASGSATITLAGTASAKAVATASATITLSGKGELPAQSWVRQKAGGNQIVGHRDGVWATAGEETRAGYNTTDAWLSTAADEISFWVTTDNVYVASHDQTTGRVFSGTSLDITTSTWAALSGKTTLVGGNPIATVDQIIADHPGRIFVIENKSNTNNATRAAYIDGLCSGYWISKCFGPSGIGWCNAAAAFGAPAMAYFFPTDLPNIANAFTGWTGSTQLIYEIADYSSSGASLPVQSDANTFYAYTQAHNLMTWASVIDTSAQRTSANTHATTAGSTLDGYMMSNVPGLVATDATVAASGSATITLSGTVAARAPVTAGATITLSGTATASAPTPAATATITLAATATAKAPATASATVTLAGTAAAAAVAPAGAATITLAATATAKAVATAAATITLAGTATAAAATPAATATITLAATGTAAQPGGASGAATITLAATAAALATAAGSAAITLAATGAQPAARATAAATITLSATAAALARAAGTATITLTGLGSASNPAAARNIAVVVTSGTTRHPAAGSGTSRRPVVTAGPRRWDT